MEVGLKPLPQRRRWWQLPEDVAVAPRKRESYSSLEIFLNNPYHWVLQYPARLRPSSILAVSSDFQLFGNLAHGLIERFYRTEAARTNAGAGLGLAIAKDLIEAQGGAITVESHAGQGSQFSIALAEVAGQRGNGEP